MVKTGYKFRQKEGKVKSNFSFSMKGKFDATERWLLRATSGVLMLTLLYSGFALYLNNRINDKIQEAEEVNLYTDVQIALANTDINNVKQKANKYKEMENNLRNINDQKEDDLSLKGSIPNLLINIMSVIPQDVQLTEIENTSANDSKHIVIQAQSETYDQLGYFKAVLREEGVLTNVTSTQGEKQDGKEIAAREKREIPLILKKDVRAWKRNRFLPEKR